MTRIREFEDDDPLFGKDVAAALEDVPRAASELQVVTFLRSRLDKELARRAAEQHSLRRRAARRFQPGRLSYLTPKGLEQATPQAVAEYRAAKICQVDANATVLDATCGIGSDAIAMAQAGLHVIAADQDPFTLSCARANFRSLGLEGRFTVADAAAPSVSADIVIMDPDRRVGGGRSRFPENWSPTLSSALRVAESFRGACIKLPPAFDPEEVPVSTGRFRWTSVRGYLAEVGLWMGKLDVEDGPRRTAILLDGKGSVERLAGDPVHMPALTPDEARNIQWLGEPDPAIIRAGLVGNVAITIGMAPLDPHIAYLGGREMTDCPFVRSWRVIGCVPLNLKILRNFLTKHNIGPITVKKRGHPEGSHILEKRYAGRGKYWGLVAITRLENGHVAYLLDPGSRPR